MYFVWLHKKTPENCCINVLRKSFLGRSQVLEFFSTTRNDRIYLFPRALENSFIGLNLCILVDYTKKYSKNAVPMTSNKIFWVYLRFSNFFRLLETTEFIFFLGLLKIPSSAWTYVFWLITREKDRKLLYQCRQKKFFVSVSDSRIFFDYLKRPKFSDRKSVV